MENQPSLPQYRSLTLCRYSVHVSDPCWGPQYILDYYNKPYMLCQLHSHPDTSDHERRLVEMKSQQEVSARQVESHDQSIEEVTLALGEAIDLGRRVSQHVEELDIRHTKSDERLLRLEDKVDTLSQQAQGGKGNTPAQVMIGQAATVNVYNRPPPAIPTDHLSSIPRPTVSSRAIFNDIPNPEFCKQHA